MNGQGAGGCLQIHEKLGGRFQDWAKGHSKTPGIY